MNMVLDSIDVEPWFDKTGTHHVALRNGGLIRFPPPTDTAFRQQRMPAIQPIVTPAWVVGLFMTVGVLFAPLGAWLKLKYAQVVEIEKRYEGDGKTIDCSISTSNEGRQVIDTRHEKR